MRATVGHLTWIQVASVRRVQHSSEAIWSVLPQRDGRMPKVTRVVIVGGGPGGYEAALVASQLGGEVTLVDSDGLGGSAVLTDCVPSKTLIATAEVMADVRQSADLGMRFGPLDQGERRARVRGPLAAGQPRGPHPGQREMGRHQGRLPRQEGPLGCRRRRP